jgi:hypothetical protein
VNAFLAVNIRTPMKHKIGYSQHGSVFLTKCKAEAGDVIYFNAR